MKISKVYLCEAETMGEWWQITPVTQRWELILWEEREKNINGGLINYSVSRLLAATQQK